MKRYTIGALFTPDFEQVLLIQKLKPEWQKGKLNLPGGHIEENETGSECVAREFKEEAGVTVSPLDWFFIGMIENEGEYTVEYFTAIYDTNKHGQAVSMTEEEIIWVNCSELPSNCLSNISWLVPFAINFHEQGNGDNLAFGHFSYKY